jgi:tRNA threonylcarbamoyladenosine biosynthesis protein TsaB
MRILAVETATLQGSIALVGEQGVLAEVRSEEGMTHAAWLMPAIERLFRMTALSLEQIDGLAVSAGPGSFTGLRIGLSTVKGLALGAGKPVVAIDTLDVLAQAVPPCRRLVCPIVDARKKEVYAALYGPSEEDGLRRLTPDMVLPPQRLAERIDAAVLFVGNGIEPYRSVLSRTLGHRALFASQRFRYPRAAVVAQLGLARLARGRTDVLETLEPLYVRPSEAELKKRHRGMS